MKIRNGFVSNSSSSSFCIYGICMNQSEMIEKIKDSLTEDQQQELEDDGYYLVELLESKTQLQVYQDEDSIWVGESWTCVGDNQTGKEFKDSVKSTLEAVLGEGLICDTYEEEIYS